jgi:CheY-like chemotaxis protein
MILLVDDFADGREALCGLIGAWGYPCQGAGNGHEALAFIRSHPPEQPLLVVLDSMMPDMSGIEVLQQIRSDPKIAPTPVVMFSAGFNTARRDEAITLGAAAWILKGSIEGIKEVCRCYERVGGVASEVKSSEESSPPKLD